MELVMKSDGQQDKAFDLDRGELSLGRQSNNDIVVMDERASRKHATVRLQPDGSVVLSDLNSSNGTLVNGRRVVGDSVLRVGDTIQIGNVSITLQQGNAASFAPPAVQPSYDYVEPQRAYDQYAPAPQNPNPYAPQPQGNVQYGAPQQPQNIDPYAPVPNAYGQNYGAPPPNAPYGAPPMQQNAPNYPQYGQNQPARPPASNRRLFLIAGIAIVVILLLALGFFLINNNSKPNTGGGTGGTPTPIGTTGLTLSHNDTVAFQSEIASHPTLGHAETLAYRSSSAPDAVIAFYKQAMPDRGYNLNSSQDKVADHYSVLRYAKGTTDWASIVAADRPVDPSLLDELTQIAPSLKGQIVAGDTVFFIVENISA